MQDEKELIKRCIERDAEALKKLYTTYSPKLWPVCLRYAKNEMAAEDIMQEGFIRIYKYLDKFEGKGSFEGWLRRTMVNTAINYYKKNLRQNHEQNIDDVFTLKNEDMDAISSMSEVDLMKVIRGLPDGYRTVFNLFIIEGYSHKEIADQLGISESTSKSQLSRARILLQKKVRRLFDMNDENDLDEQF